MLSRPLGWLALTLAAAGLVCVVVPGPGMYLALGLGIFGGAAGWVGYRRVDDPGPARLAGAGAMTLGCLALVLGSLRYGLTLAAIGKLESLL